MNWLQPAVALGVLVVAAMLWVGAQGTPIGTVDLAPGLAVYNANCVACHQATGSGLPAIFPPLKDHVPELLAAEGGRRHLVSVVLFGMTGAVTVAETRYDGLMPPWGHLTDVQLANVLNYVVTAWGNDAALPQGFTAFSPEEVLEARGAALDAHGVYLMRQTLDLE